MRFVVVRAPDPVRVDDAPVVDPYRPAERSDLSAASVLLGALAALDQQRDRGQAVAEAEAFLANDPVDSARDLEPDVTTLLDALHAPMGDTAEFLAEVATA